MREIRLSVDQFEEILKNAGILKPGEAFNDAHMEPGELVVKIEEEEALE